MRARLAAELIGYATVAGALGLVGWIAYQEARRRGAILVTVNEP